MEFLDNKTPQVDFYNIYALIIAVISNIKECTRRSSDLEASNVLNYGLLPFF